MERIDPISARAIKGQIRNKIFKIQQQKAIERMRNDIPTSIASIIEDLVGGTIDFQKANTIIDEEAKRRVESSPKARFALTEEQQRRQILIQIRTAIIEKADKYCIKNPEELVAQIQELCGENVEQSTRIVVENLINRKDFETAKRICDRFSVKDEDGQIGKQMQVLKNLIRNAELSEIVLKGINRNGTEEEDRTFFEMMEKGIKMGNINLAAISLGKSKDGSRNISLADIWTGEGKQKNGR